ncbi:MAG: bifunctional riboflavin kinase/FAD synthetase [Pirellulaceae bacterium]
MKLFRELDQLPANYRNGALAIGNFDGVHQGHAEIVQRVRQQADQLGGPAVIFTFDPHPVRILRPEMTPPPLTWTNRKVELLGALGIDAVIAYPTDRALLDLTPEEFFEQIVIQRIQANAMVEGPNFNFGRNRAGTIETLTKLCADHSVQLDILEPYRLPGESEFVSSSRIRKLIAAGNVAEAGSMLTQPYRIRGMVTHGAGRGAKLGFPTANLEAVDTLIPALGVYAGVAHQGENAYAAAVHIGPNPTFGESIRKIEAHLLDFHDSIYGEPLELSFLERIRDVVTFSDTDQLKQQLAADLATTRNRFQQYRSHPSAPRG